MLNTDFCNLSKSKLYEACSRPSDAGFWQVLVVIGKVEVHVPSILKAFLMC